jgi:NAD(P)-dependent dehydrogenase (short-subunit alcohol dehydrogenase family)
VRHVVLVGATDGIGRALAAAYLERSWRVAVVGRSAAKVDAVVAKLAESYPGSTVVGGVLDVTRRDAVVPALEGALAELGQMDLLVYCAGVMGEGGATAADPAHLVAVNFLGAVDVLEWGARYFTEAGGGRLAAIGSVAGDRGRKGNPVYAAAKAALHQYLEALRHRLHPAGVGVTTIKPGWVRTRMLGRVPRFPPAITPELAARLIVKKLERGRDGFYVPAWWAPISLALRMMPRPVYKRVAPS